jgi:hypothetical protein
LVLGFLEQGLFKWRFWQHIITLNLFFFSFCYE